MNTFSATLFHPWMKFGITASLNNQMIFMFMAMGTGDIQRWNYTADLII